MTVEDLINQKQYKSLSFENERETVKYLKSLPEKKSFEIILEMAKQRIPTFLVVAKKVLNEKELVIQLLKYGFEEDSNAQSIKLWLQFAIPKLGARYVIKLIDELSLNNTKLADNALYWLPKFISKEEKKAWKLFEIFKMKTEIGCTQEKEN